MIGWFNRPFSVGQLSFIVNHFCILPQHLFNFGANSGIRTHDNHFGKVTLYQAELCSQWEAKVVIFTTSTNLNIFYKKCQFCLNDVNNKFYSIIDRFSSAPILKSHVHTLVDPICYLTIDFKMAPARGVEPLFDSLKTSSPNPVRRHRHLNW